MYILEKDTGKLNPSTDTPAHLKFTKNTKIQRNYTHSVYATTGRKAKPIPLIGTTHADWEKEVPLVDYINKISLNKNYEKITGTMIIKTLEKKKLDAYTCPGVIVAGHGPFTWE